MSTPLLGATKPLQGAVKDAGFDLLGFNPESVPALRAREQISTVDLFKPRPDVVGFRTIDKPVEGCNSCRPSNEELNPTWVARYVRLLLFGLLDLAWIQADGTRKSAFTDASNHDEPPLVGPVPIAPFGQSILVPVSDSAV
jgi:hypothetical protein